MAKFTSKPTIYKNFKLDAEAYNIDYLKKLNDGTASVTVQEYRKEFNRLKSVVRKRVKRMEEAGLTKGEYYKRAKRMLSKKEFDTRSMVFEMRNMHKMLTDPVGSVGGIHERDDANINRWHEDGLEWVNKDNLYDFYDYLEDARNAGYDKIYGSERMLELFETAVKNGWNTKEIFAEFDAFVSERERVAKTEYEFTLKDIEDFKNYQSGKYD